jgi:Zn-dependent protease with chaperone function
MTPTNIDINPYLYVGANPVNAVDPLGLYTAFGDERFKREVDEAFRRIRGGLERDENCCARYFSDRGIDLGAWALPGGPPYIHQRPRAPRNRPSACGWAQASPEFEHMFVNWGCFRRPDPCRLASLIMHEMGHLARQDTEKNEPPDFFRVCNLDGCVAPGRFR